jgi:hypothetical protein
MERGSKTETRGKSLVEGDIPHRPGHITLHWSSDMIEGQAYRDRKSPHFRGAHAYAICVAIGVQYKLKGKLAMQSGCRARG